MLILILEYMFTAILNLCIILSYITHHSYFNNKNYMNDTARNMLATKKLLQVIVIIPVPITKM